MTTIIPNNIRVSYNQYVQTIDRIKRYDHEYWDLNQPSISDAEYDALYAQATDFEWQYPEFRLLDSPIGQLRDKTNGNGRRTVRRRTIMLSTEKANDTDKVVKWMQKTTKALSKAGAQHPDLFTVEWKYDGDSCSLVYVDGTLIEASYGKGIDGADCLQHVRYVQCIPQHINAKGRIEVRGEVVCPFANLSKTGYKTCRSAASGYLANEQADERMGRLMEFCPYWVEFSDNVNYASLTCKDTDGIRNMFSSLVALINTSHEWHALTTLAPEIHTAEEICEMIDRRNSIRSSYTFPTDGLVIKAYDMDMWDSLGATDHHPKYSIAYKFPPQLVKAHLTHIDYTIGGKTGKRTPVAHFQPTTVNSILVEKASLGSEKIMANLGLSYQSHNITVMLGLANDVIPHVFSVVDEKSSEKTCENEKVSVSCTTENEPKHIEPMTAEEQLRTDVLQFCSPDAMNIEGLTPESINELIEHGIIQIPIDVMAIPVEIIVHQEPFEHFNRHDIPTIYASINRAKKEATAAQLLYSFCIDGITPQLAKTLVEEFGSARMVVTKKRAELAAVKGMNDDLAANIVTWYICQSKQRILWQYASEDIDVWKEDADYTRRWQEKYDI